MIIARFIKIYMARQTRATIKIHVHGRWPRQLVRNYDCNHIIITLTIVDQPSGRLSFLAVGRELRQMTETRRGSREAAAVDWRWARRRTDMTTIAQNHGKVRSITVEVDFLHHNDVFSRFSVVHFASYAYSNIGNIWTGDDGAVNPTRVFATKLLREKWRSIRVPQDMKP